MKTTRRMLAVLLVITVLLVNGSVAALADNVLNLPASLQAVEEEAFMGDTSIDRVVLPEGVKAIKARAFSGSSLREINLPDSLNAIDVSAFDSPDKVSVTANEGSYAYNWAVENGYIRLHPDWPESLHNYSNNSDITWEYTYPGSAEVLRVTFSQKTEFEEDCDYLYVTDSAGKATGYTGKNLSGVTLYLPGNGFSLHLTSDGSVTRYGFAITDITPLSRQEYEDYVTAHPYEVRHVAEGAVEIIRYNGTSDVLEIPAEIDGATVTGICDRAFEGNTFISKVTIPGSVKRIGEGAFRECTSLGSVTLGDGIERIGDSAFQGCASLTQVVIPGSVKWIYYSAFSECTSLGSVTLGDGIEEIGDSAFSGCASLTQVVIPGSVKEILDSAFQDCANLSSVTLGEGIKEIGYYAFNGCMALKEITLPVSLIYISNSALYGSGLETVNATPGSYAYTWAVAQGYIAVEGDLVILPYDDDGVFTDNGGSLLWDLLSGQDDRLRIFTRVSADTTVEWSADWIEIEDDYGDNLLSGQSVITPEDDTIYVDMDYNMTGEARQADIRFTCGEISRTLTIRQLPFMIAQLTAPDNLGPDWGYYFDDGNTPEVYYPKDDLEFVWSLVDGAVRYEFDLLGEYDDELIEDRAIEDGDIRDGAIHITVPADMLLPTNRMDYTAILTVYDVYGHWYNNVYRFGIYDAAAPEWGYRYDYSWDDDTDERYIEGVVITNYTGDSATPVVPSTLSGYPVVAIRGAFDQNKNITAVTLPDTLLAIGYDAFEGCTGLRTISLPAGVTEIGDDAFNGCTSLESINLPAGVTGIGENAFNGCTSLESINLPAGVTGIGYGAFSGCTSLQEITVPASVTYIAERAFNGCTSLESINLPAGVTGIGENAFNGCTSLESINLPVGVTEIGYGTFSGCTSLQEITVPASVTYIAGSAFDGCTSLTEYNAPEGSYAYQWGVRHGFIKEEYVLESDHDYSDDADETWQYTHPEGADALKVTFSEMTMFEDGCDYLYVNDSEDVEIGYTGEQLSGATLYLPGDSFSLRLTSDGSITEFGFGITAITAISRQEYEDYLAAHPFTTAPNGNGVEITGYIGKATALVIPDQIDGKKVNAISSTAFRNRTELVSVVVPEGVTELYSGTFSGCTSLASLSLPESVNNIPDYAFDDCYALVITAPEGSYAYNWAQAHGFLQENAVLESAHPFVGETAEEYTYASPDAASALKVTFSFRTYIYDLTIMDGSGSSNHYHVNDLTGQTVVIPGNSFKLTLNQYPELWSHSRFGFRITAIEPMTESEYDTYRTEHPFNTWSYDDYVMITGYIGKDTALVIPDKIDGREVQVISGQAFWNHTELVSVVVPEGVYSIYNGAFYGCTSLASVSLPESVSRIDDNAFDGCDALTITAPEGSYAYDWAQAHGFLQENAVLESAHPFVGETAEEYTYAWPGEAYALKVTFSAQTIVSNLTIVDGSGSSKSYTPNELAGQTVVIPGNAFKLTLSQYPEWWSQSRFGFRITAIEPMTESEYDTYRTEHPFNTRPNGDGVEITGYIGKDTALVIPDQIDGRKVRSLSYNAFQNHTELVSVVVPEGIFSINNGTFYGCTSLASVSLPESVSRIDDNAFAGCDVLTITAPEGSYAYDWAQAHGFLQENAVLESAHPFVGETAEEYTYAWPGEAFALKVTFSARTIVSNLTIVDGSGSSKSYTPNELAGQTVVIPGNAFKLTLSQYPEGWSQSRFGFRITAIEPMTESEYDTYRTEHPFNTSYYGDGVVITGYIGKDTALVIPDQIDGRKVNAISYNAFQNHTELVSVVVPEGVTYINNGTFYGCTSLASVSLPESVSRIDDYAFDGCDVLTVTAPEGSYAYDWAQEHNIPVVAGN